MIILNHKIWTRLFSFLLITSSAFAQEAEESVSLKERIGLSGSLRAGYWSEDKQFDPDQDFMTGGVFLSLKPQEMSFGRLSFEGYVQADNFARDKYSRGDLREGYWSKSFGSFDLAVGRQIIVWGRADKINPTDSFSQRDYTRLFTDDEEARRGLFAVQAAYNLESSKLIFIYQPEWRPAIIPINPSVGLQLTSQRPDNSSENFGFKYDYSSSDFDASASYYNGNDKIPDASFASLSEVFLTYNKVETFGADFATQWGRYGLRAEAAYTDTKNTQGDLAEIKNPFLYAVLGVERTFFEYLNVNVQVLYKHIDNFRPSESFAFPSNLLNAQLRINALQIKEDMYGYSTRTSYKMFNETLEMELAFIQWQPRGDYFLRPKVTYALSDDFKFITGAEIYQGKDDTFFGRFEDSSAFFSEIRWYF